MDVSTDFNWSSYTPIDSTGDNYDIFASAYRNIRFAIQPQTQYQLTKTDLANLPGLAYKFFGDVSLWRMILAYNGISDPMSEVAVGLVINIPARADVIAYLTQQSANSSQPLTI
jgi:hypothetical protein